MRQINLLVLILYIAGFFYLFRLDSTPPGLFADEASTGINIYSILKTGKDEYGKFLPFSFRQMGSYTPPLYIYLSTPLMAIFGESEFSVRLLSVICGLVLTTLVFYLLQQLKICKSAASLFFSTLLFSVSPWLVFFSRMGYEQNLAFMFLTLTLVLFIKSLKNPKYFLLLFPTASLATYADFPMRFLMPLVALIYSMLFAKEINFSKNLKFITMGIIIAIFIQIPNMYMFNTKSFLSKKEHFYGNTVLAQAAKIEYLPSAVTVPLAFVREFSSQYVNYFSPQSLFSIGDPDPQRSIPEMGVLYNWTVILYLYGFYLLYKRHPGLERKITISLLLITPITGALTHQPFHVQRTLALLLPLTFVMSMAIDAFFVKFGKIIMIPILTILLLVSLISLYRGYFILLPQLRAPTWAFQYKELANFIHENPDKHFVIDQEKNLKPENIAYFQLAFYLKTDPKILQSSSDPSIAKNYYNDVDFSHVRSLANIETKPIEWGETEWKDVILVGDTVAISDIEVERHNLKQVLEIKDPNDNIILRGFQTKREARRYDAVRQ